MPVSRGYWSLLESNLLGALDERIELPFAEVRDACLQAQGLEYLEEKLADLVDTSLFDVEPGVRDEANFTLAEIARVHKGREGRKLGVDKNGLCLAAAYVVLAILESPAPQPLPAPNEDEPQEES